MHSVRGWKRGVRAAREWLKRSVSALLVVILPLALSGVVMTPAPAMAAGTFVTADLTDGMTPAQIAQMLVGPGVSISNVTYTGADTGLGTFSNGAGIVSLDSGIVLSSGAVDLVQGPNNDSGAGIDNTVAGDAALDTLAASTTYDASILEFDFVPTASNVYFSYVFGSEEYNEYVYGGFNDVFAFWVNGTNYATVGSQPVSIDTINYGNPYGSEPNSHKDLYLNNEPVDPDPAPYDTQLDGFTTKLVLSAPVNKDQTNHMRLAIADAGDGILDSDVFIGAGSLAVDPPNLNVSKMVDFNNDGVFSDVESGAAGTDATWRVVVTNTGGSALPTVTVTDDNAHVYPAKFSLAPSESTTFTYSTTVSVDTTNNVTAVAEDAGGVTVSKTDQAVAKVLIVDNDPPVVAADAASVDVDEGATASMSGTFSDPNGDAVELSASTGVVVAGPGGTWSWTGSFPDGPAAPVVTITAKDEHDATASATFTVNVANVAPECGAIATPADPLAGTSMGFECPFTDAGVLDTHVAVWDWGDGGATSPGLVSETSGSGTASGTHEYAAPGLYTITLTITDKDGGVDVCTTQLLVGENPNSPPTVAADSDSGTAEEGTPASMTGTFSDPDGDAVMLSASFGSVTPGPGGTWTWEGTFLDGPTMQTVTITAQDEHGAVATTSFEMMVANAAPWCGPIITTGSMTVGSELSFEAAFGDPGVLDTHVALWDFGDGTAPVPGVVSEAAGSGTATAAHSFASAGTYVVTLTVTDSDGASHTCTAEVIIGEVPPASHGFITGAGKVISPEGAYLDHPSVHGLAKFTITAKYVAGHALPVGQFSFRIGKSLKFSAHHLSSLEIVDHTATVRGTGRIGKSGPYDFEAVFVDGPKGHDSMSLKIWTAGEHTLVYDSGMLPVSTPGFHLHK